ncbi:MAG TPA: ESX secretion-associated protein EspG [Pseudonocardiaceae bacterium]
MTGTLIDDAVELHPVEVDLLCSFAEVDAPFPLDVPSTGTTEIERRLIFQAAAEQLAARGLAGARGPVGVARTFVRMLGSATGTLYLVLAVGERSLGAVVLVDGMHALLAIQSPDEGGHLVRMTELTVDDAVRALLSLVPTVDAAAVPSFTMPLQPVHRVFDLLRQTRTALSDTDIDALLWECGIDETTARRMTSLQPVTGSGQCGATVRGRGWQQTGAETRWIDTPRGRFALASNTGPDGSAWANVHPLSRNDLRAAIRTLATQVREAT